MNLFLIAIVAIACYLISSTVINSVTQYKNENKIRRILEISDGPKKKFNFNFRYLCLFLSTSIIVLILIPGGPIASLLLGGSSSLVLILSQRRLVKNKRRRLIFKQIPEFLSMLSLGLSSGENIDGAWNLATKHMPPGPLKVEIEKTQFEFKSNYSREVAIRRLIDRIDDSRLSSIWSLILQSFKFGSPIDELILEQTDILRRNYLLEIEKKAQTAPVRLLFPILIFIFPSIFIVIFGPLYLYFLQGGFF